MCGIIGFSAKNPEPFRSRLESACKTLRHRGPDAVGTYVLENVGLGHTRLSIIDLSQRSNQPMTSSNGDWVITYNGEFYNFKEVGNQLGLNLRTQSDTEVLLEGFAQKGLNILEEINGMFAFGVHNKKSGEIFLARDRMGIKPLYYYYGSNGDFAFASELKALVALGVPTSINDEAVKTYLYWESIPHPMSIYKDIYKLPPGHFLKYLDGRIKVHKYYDVIEKASGLHYRKTEWEYLEEFDGLMNDSVRLRQISDVPVGVFLSGGTDSTLVAQYFQEQNQKSIRSFNVKFSPSVFDESQYAREAANTLGTEHREIVVDESEVLENLSQLYQIYDEPYSSQSIIPSYTLCREARKEVTVALAGDGGDETHMGYGYYPWYKRKNWLEVPGLSLLNPLLGRLLLCLGDHLSSRGEGRAERFQKAARMIQFRRGKSAWLDLWSQEQYLFLPKEIEQLLGPMTPGPLEETWSQIDGLPIGDFQKVSLFDLKHYLPDNLLHKVDMASMASSLEVRVPLLDHKLVEFALKLPVDLKINNGVQKYLLKEVLSRRFSNSFVHRKKWGFGSPIQKWMASNNYSMVYEWLDPKRLSHIGDFNSSYLTGLKAEYIKGNEIHYKRIWSLMTLVMWHQANRG